METKLNARADNQEAERFEAMMESPAFKRFVGRVVDEFERARLFCERGEDEIELRRAQGSAAALRMVLGLPQQMLGELKGKTANK